MNYWFAELTGMDVVTPLFDYFEVRMIPCGLCTCLMVSMSRKHGYLVARRRLSTCTTYPKDGSPIMRRVFVYTSYHEVFADLRLAFSLDERMSPRVPAPAQDAKPLYR